MRKKYIGLIICIISTNQVLCNVSIFENKFIFTSMTTLQDTTLEDKPEPVLEPFQNNGSFKSPGKALLYSGILPGMGQAYMGNWMRALFFVSLEGIAIGTWYQNNQFAEDKRRDYSYYAKEHWDFSNWIHDYYKWYKYDENTPNLNKIREAFINNSDSVVTRCYQDPTQDLCYIDIWENSHSVDFYWEGNLVKSNDEGKIVEIFEDLCGSSPYQRICNNDISQIKVLIEEHGLSINTTHHFYEGIQKYDMFFAGWDDNEEAELVIKPNGDKNATSPNQSTYRSLWGDYNTVKTLAVNGGKFMLINRVVSMVDAMLLAKNGTMNMM